MGNRKQPFGYRMTLGEITIQPEEAELVRFIFQGYSTGATLGELTKALCRQEIPYYEGRTWNKNMVSRILEDSRVLFEGNHQELKHYDSKVPEKVKQLEPQIAQFQMQMREYEMFERLERMHEENDKDDNHYHEYHPRPSFDVASPADT